MPAEIHAQTITATGTFQGGRCRLKAFVCKTSSSGSPAIVFKNGSGGATQLSMVFNTGQDVEIWIPENGMIFPDECHATLTNIDSLTGFFG